MYEQENQREEEHLAVAAGTDPHSADVGVVEQEETHPDCQTCKRNFWTSVLNAVIKIATIVLAAFGIQSFGTDD